MPAIITTNLKLHNAEQFVEALSETASTTFYVFISKTIPWENNLDSVGTVPSEIDNQDLIYRLYDNMIAVKKISLTDIDLVVPRFDWIANTVYNHYDHKSNNLFNFNITSKINKYATVTKQQQPFYVLADTIDYNVYKCISNNKGVPSVIKPTGTSNNIVTLGDGYKWKYMYTIPIGKRNKFVNSDFMYVSNYNYSSGVDGGIDFIEIIDGGSNYVTIPTVSITGDGSGAAATVDLSGNSISNVIITSSGSKYRYANVTITGGGGSNAKARAIISPKNGHAANATNELGGFFVMFSSSLVDTENNIFPIDNDFRILGIIKDPLLYNTSTVATGSSYRTRKSIKLKNTTGTFLIDEKIEGIPSTTDGIITSIAADYANSNVVINYLQAENVTTVNNFFPAGDKIVGKTSGANGDLEFVSNEGIEPDSGQIIYVDTFRPIQRGSGQTEVLQLVIEF